MFTAQRRTTPMGSVHSGPLHQPGPALLRTVLQSGALPTPPSFPILLLHGITSALEPPPLYPSPASAPADLVLCVSNSALVSASHRTRTNVTIVLGGQKEVKLGGREQDAMINHHLPF